MSIKHIIDNEIRELNLDLIIEGLTEVLNGNISRGNFTTSLSETNKVQGLSEDSGVVVDGVADKYAEKEFNIPNPNKTMNSKAIANMDKIDPPMGKLIGRVVDSPVFLNPHTLKDFEPEIRALSDKNNNLFVAQANGYFAHYELGVIIQRAGFNIGKGAYDDAVNITWLRVKNSNIFGFADSMESYFEDNTINYENVVRRTNELQSEHKEFKFIPKVYWEIKKNSIVNEDGDVVADIVNDELNKNNCTLEEGIENNKNENIEDKTNSNILSEGLSDILYHFTYIPHLRNILKYNKFATSTNLGSNADASKDKGKFFFFSTQRTKGMSGYAQHHGNNVAIVLDGRKLNYTFKGFATDYWNWSKKRSDYSDVSSYNNALQSEENEDRIVTNKPYIDNANKYIIEIHVLIIPEHNNQEGIEEINNLCQGYNIPIYFYLDDNSFKLQDKRKAVAPDQLNLEVAPEPSAYDVSKDERDIYDIKWFFKDISPSIIAGNNNDNSNNNDNNNDNSNNNSSNNNERDIIEKLLKDALEKGGQIDQFENVMSDINDKVKRLSSSWGRMNADDAYRSLSADIHNKRGDPNPYLRELLKLLINDMKKWHVKNLKEYFNKKFQAGIKENIENNSNENIKSSNENMENNNENMSKSLKNTHDRTVKNAKDIDPSILYETQGEFTNVFHGTSLKGAENIQKYGVKISKSFGGYFGWGFYTAIDYNLAKTNYADFSDDNTTNEKGVILEFKINPDANILDLRKDEDFKIWQPYSKAINQPNLYQVLVKHGIDGLYDNSFEGVVIYNPKVLTLVKQHYI